MHTELSGAATAVANSDGRIPDSPPCREALGREIRWHRSRLGISQRELARALGLSAHSNIGDYERGARIPPSDIVADCERLLEVAPGGLQALRRAALAERADSFVGDEMYAPKR